MKRTLTIALAIVLTLTLAGCGASVERENDKDTSMFVVVEEAMQWRVLYHKETKVMYVESYGGYNSGNFAVLVNPDGSPMLWGGK